MNLTQLRINRQTSVSNFMHDIVRCECAQSLVNLLFADDVKAYSHTDTCACTQNHVLYIFYSHLHEWLSVLYYHS